MSEGKCYACGGRVGASGMAEGGEVEESPSGEHEIVDDAVNSDGESTQMRDQADLTRNAQRSFVKAVRASRGAR